MTAVSRQPERPTPAVSIAVFRGDTVLVIQRGKEPLQGLWSLPGGHIEPGETAAAAALRELLEETGLVARLHGVADIVDVIGHDAEGQLTRHYVIAVFAGEWTGGEPVAASDCAAAHFMPPEALAGLATTDRLAAVVAKAHDIIRGVRRTSLAAVQQDR